MSASLARPSTSPSVAPASGPRLPRIQAFGLSHVGMLRDTNEDAYGIVAAHSLFMVADGIGGRPSGELASRLAVDTIRTVFENPDLTWPSGFPLRPNAVDLSLLRASVERASAHVRAVADADPKHEGMGTTVSALLVLEDRVALAHVGDSRIYGLRGRRFEQLTEDHTLANVYAQAGVLRPEDVASSKFNSILARAVGTEESVEVDTRLVALQPGDTFLLATDGLHGVVDDAAMAAILLRERDFDGRGVAARRARQRVRRAGQYLRRPRASRVARWRAKKPWRARRLRRYGERRSRSSRPRQPISAGATRTRTRIWSMRLRASTP